MNELLIQFFLLVYLGGLIWIAVRKATEDGFYTSVCTFAVLLIAYIVADREWYTLVNFLRTRLGVNEVASISAGFWIGFIVVVLPGLVFIRLLADVRTPFPGMVERYGCMLVGALAGMVVFAATIQSVYLFEGFYETVGEPLQIFHPIFHAFGSTWVPKETG